jgi:hypothetical protein
MHVKVFMYRLLESIISVVAVMAVLYAFHASSSWVPLAMTIGPVVLAFVIRQHVLLPSAAPDAFVLDDALPAMLSDVLQPYTDVYMAGGAS